MFSKRLSNTAEKIKNASDIPRDIFMPLLLALVGAGGFMLGRLSMHEEARKEELKLVQLSAESNQGTTTSIPEERSNMSAIAGQGTGTPLLEKPSGLYVGSKSGTVYHLPWCSGALRIKGENMVWFASKQEAESRGYHPASNCKGI